MRLPKRLAEIARKAAATVPQMLCKADQLYAVQWAMAVAYRRGHRDGMLVACVVWLIVWGLYVATN